MIHMYAEVKDRFFDRAAIIAKIGRENARRLSRAGAFIRQRARTDILRRPSRGKRRNRIASPPGRPPFVHSRDSFATFRNILFALDSDWETVIIGVRVVPSLRLKSSTALTAAELNEVGGSARITESFVAGAWRPGNMGRGAITRVRTARYPKRPFMLPALQKEVAAGTIAGLFVRTR